MGNCPKKDYVKVVRCIECKKSARTEDEYICMMRGELTQANGYCHKGKLRGEE